MRVSKSNIVRISVSSLMVAMCFLKGYGQQVGNQPIILSSRWFHPINRGDTLSTIKMIDLYKPDRIDWMYCDDSTKLAQLKKKGVKYSLTLNPQIPDSLDYTVKGRIVDLNGAKLVAPWMKNWKSHSPYWGCVNSPDFKKVFYKRSKQLIDLGAYGLFLDDARFNDHAFEWGGCYCTHCMKGFTDYLVARKQLSPLQKFSYKQYLLTSTGLLSNKDTQYRREFQLFQKLSVIKFLKAWRSDMSRYAKRPLTFLVNNSLGTWNEIYRVFDIGIAELTAQAFNSDLWLKGVQQAKSLKKHQYYTLASHNESLQVQTALAAYLEGSSLVIPWDVFAPTAKGGAERFYGKSEKFVTVFNLLKRLNKRTNSFARIEVDKVPLQITSTTGEIEKIRAYRNNSTYVLLLQCKYKSSYVDKMVNHLNYFAQSSVNQINVIRVPLKGSKNISRLAALYPHQSKVNQVKSEIVFIGEVLLIEIAV